MKSEARDLFRAFRDDDRRARQLVREFHADERVSAERQLDHHAALVAGALSA